MGSGPAPWAATRLPQNAWSLRVVGQITVGFPARIPSAVVPAQSWGADSMAYTSAGRPGGIRPQPVTSTPRCPVLRRAAIAASTTLLGVQPARLPKPTYTGGGPLAR